MTTAIRSGWILDTEIKHNAGVLNVKNSFVSHDVELIVLSALDVSLEEFLRFQQHVIKDWESRVFGAESGSILPAQISW